LNIPIYIDILFYNTATNRHRPYQQQKPQKYVGRKYCIDIAVVYEKINTMQRSICIKWI